MRSWVWSVVLLSSVASADDGGIRIRRLSEAHTEPLLHLDATTPDMGDAEGGLVDGREALFELGPRARIAARGTWWQTGLAPSRFAEDLPYRSWRASAELSYDLGPFRVGMNASMGHTGDSTHRMVGLFAYRTFRLSRWMHAWIVLGVGYEQWIVPGQQEPRQGVTAGLTLGTTFR